MSGFIKYIENAFASEGLEISSDITVKSHKNSDTKATVTTLNCEVSVYSNCESKSEYLGKFNFSTSSSMSEVKTLLTMHHLSITSLVVLNKCQQFFKVTSSLMGDSASILFKEFLAEKQLEAIVNQEAIHDRLLNKGYIQVTKEIASDLIDALIREVKVYKARTNTIYAQASYNFTLVNEKGERKNSFLAVNLKNKIRVMNGAFSQISKAVAIQNLTGSYFKNSQEVTLGDY